MLLFVLFLVVPLIEIGLFIAVGQEIGLWPTLATVVATAVLGTILLRIQGIAALRRLQETLNRGENPGGPLAHGALILVAGVVLLTPGFFTDAVGFLLLIPPVRQALITHYAARVVVMAAGGGAQKGGPGPVHRDRKGNATIDGDFVVEEAPGDGDSPWRDPDPTERR
ncbi:MAG: FxsA family protein [Pseudomonadota bacterium]